MFNKLESTIVRLLQKIDRPVSRTELIKFLYLIDIEFAQLYDRSLTGTPFVRHHFGPYSADIVDVAERLNAVGVIVVDVTASAYGGSRYEYSICPSGRNVELSLEPRERRVIDSVVDGVRDLSLEHIKRVAYATEPMRRVRERERRLEVVRLGEELAMKRFDDPRPKRSLSRLRRALATINREDRGTDHEYETVVGQEAKALEPYKIRANMDGGDGEH